MPKKKDNIDIKYIDSSLLKPAKYNPRQSNEKQYEELKKSVTRFGFVDPLIVNSAKNRHNIIIGGHFRLRIAIDLGIQQVPVVYVNIPDIKKERELNLRLNKNLGEWDFDLLANFDENLLIDVGFTSQEIDNIFQLGPDDKDDEIPENVPAKTKLGDLYQLGRHRLLCGDSTKVEDVERLMDGKKADLVFTDPPYGIDVVQGSKVGGGGYTKFGKIVSTNFVKSRNYNKIIGDQTIDVARNFYNLCIDMKMRNIVLWGGNYFTDFLSPSRCWLIWDKEMTGDFSEAEMAWTSFLKGGVKVFKHLWNGLSREGNRKDELKGRVHPTQKPVGLFAQIFKRFDGFIVIFDGFLGSGSTLIACEKTNRICYGMELDPKYCDVIVKRWEDYTNEKAKQIV